LIHGKMVGVKKAHICPYVQQKPGVIGSTQLSSSLRQLFIWLETKELN
jgi:hypothetical protein